MEIYAAFLEYADHHVGRVIDALADLGILDDTLIYYIIGDNGASAEGSLIGAFNDKTGGEAPDLSTPELLIEHIDDLGSRKANNHYALRSRACDEHAVSMDQAGRVAFRRHAQRDHHPLAEGHQRQGRDPLAVPPRDRHR